MTPKASAISQPASASAPAKPRAPRWQRLLLSPGFVLTLCLMGGGYGLVATLGKIESIETILAGKTGDPTLEEKSLTAITDALGYNGFLGAAARFSDLEGEAQLDKMQSSLAEAEQALMPLTASAYADPDKNLLAEVRTIFELYRTQMNAAEQSFISHTPDPKAAQNLLVLTNALPELTARLTALIAHKNTAMLKDVARLERRLLGLILLLAGVTIAGASYAGFWFHRRHRAALDAMADTVRHWRTDDIEAGLPAADRIDAVGALARELDLLRKHFAAIPDVTLTGEPGATPLRLRFDGKVKGVVEALVQHLIKTSETLGVSSKNATAMQTQATALVADLKRAQENLETTARTTSSLNSAAQRTGGEVERLVDILEDRAEALTKLTSLTGSKMASALHSVQTSEKTWRATTEAGQSLIGKFAVSADELSERLTAASSLLSAGGRILTETSERSKTHMDEAVAQLREKSAAMSALLAGPAEQLEEIIAKSAAAAGKSEQAAGSLDQAIAEIRLGAEKLLSTDSSFGQMGERLETLEQSFASSIDTLTGKGLQLAELLEAMQTLPAELRQKIMADGSAVADAASKLTATGKTLETTGQRLLAQTDRLESKAIAPMFDRLNGIHNIAGSLAALVEQLEHSMPQIADAIDRVRKPDGISEESIARLNETLDTNIAATEVTGIRISSLLQNNRDQITNMLERLRAAQEQAILAQSQIVLPQPKAKSAPAADASPPLNISSEELTRIRVAAEALSATAEIMAQESADDSSGPEDSETNPDIISV